MPRWFRKKRRGYGWTPCTWQGWVVMAVFTAGVVVLAVNARTLGQAQTLAGAGALVLVLTLVAAFTSGKDSDA